MSFWPVKPGFSLLSARATCYQRLLCRPHLRVWPGAPYPLGATWDGVGVNFAIFSEHATKVELCLFDSPDAELESLTIPLSEQTDMVWHGYLPDMHPGQLYGTGSMARCASLRLPLQSQQAGPRSYAKVIGRRGAGTTRCSDSNRVPTTPPSTTATARRARSRQSRIPRSPGGTIARCARRGTIRSSTSCTRRVSQLNRSIPEHLRGTYLGLASEPAIRHLTSLGVTAVELMPVHHHADEWHLVQKGLRNYWGYNTLSLSRRTCATPRRSSRSRACANSR